MLKLTSALALLITILGAGNAANILCVFTSYSPSHLIIHMSYARVLVERGHNVTVVTTHQLRDKNPGYHHIYIPPTEARYKEITDTKSEVTQTSGTLDAMLTSFRAVTIYAPTQFDAVKDQRFQDFMHNPSNKFDLLIMGYFFSDYLFGLGAHFNCPIVISWMDVPNYFVNRHIGNPPELPYVPSTPLFGIVHTFAGRLANFAAFFFAGATFGTTIDWQMANLYNELFPAPDYPTMEEASKRVSLLLCNSHFSEGIIRPNVPALIEVGGIQVKDQPDPLPMDLQEIFNNSSEHGVIYLSFGSNYGSDSLKPETFEIIFKTLAGLKQTIIWQWVGPNKPGLSPNIHYRKWLPQDDILAQPNLRLFITHAGKGSVIESQYHGVPMVAIPLFADQPGNADLLVKNGFGLQINRNTMEGLSAAIEEVLQNPIYREKVQRFATLYRDRPMSAKETAVYWIEYVIRHKGAYHMQSPMVHLTRLQYISADVVGFLLLVVFLVYKFIRIIAGSIWAMVRRSEKPKVKKQ